MAADAPPSISGNFDCKDVPAALNIVMTIPAVRAVAAAVNIPARPDARESADVAILN
jgi:hypothetical protein